MERERIKMERLFGLLDASFAIVMTILVLEVNWPHEPTLEGIWGIRYDLVAYATSFLMIFSIWRSFNLDFARVKTISNRAINGFGFTLFFASILPFATGYYVENIETRIGAIVYAVSFLVLTIAIYYFYYQVEKSNPNDEQIYDDTEPDIRDLIMVIINTLIFIVIWFKPSFILWMQVIVVLAFNISEETFPFFGIHLRELFGKTRK